MYKFLFAVSFFCLTTFKFYIDQKNCANSSYPIITENCNVFLLKLSHINEEVLVSWCLRWAEKCLKTLEKKTFFAETS